jgi:CubicO group peptidase (beta-lactamase class C family)
MINPSLLETLIPDQIPGIAVGIVTPTTIATQIVGYSALVPQREPLRANTRFDLASLTKVVITTTILLQLVEEGQLRFSTPIQSILPDFIHPHITVGDLLSHQSGLPADDPHYKTCQDAAALRRFTLTHPLSVEPRTRVIYTDFGFLILGWVIEALEGSLDEVAQRRIAQPLGLTTLGFNPEPALACAPTEVSPTRGVIRGVVHDGKAFVMNGVAGNAGCFATLQDVCRFTQSFLDDRHRLLSKESLAQLRQSHTVGLDFQRTWGWYRHDPSCAFGHYVSDDCLFHTGFTGTSITLDFTKQIGLVILTNRIHPTRDNPHITTIRNTLHDAVFSRFK